MNEVNLRSEEVQEMLGTPPPWLVRWGILMAFSVLVVIAYLAFFITYPRSIKLEGKVFNEERTRELKTTQGTEIRDILVTNEDTVIAGQALLVYDSPGDFADVLTLDDHLATLLETDDDSTLINFSFPKDFVLGELEEYFFDFLEQQKEVVSLYNNAGRRRPSREVDREIRRSQLEITANRREKEGLVVPLQNASRDYQRAVNLRQQGKADDYDVRQAESVMLSYERLLQEKDNNIRFHQSNINNLRRLLRDSETNTTVNRERAMKDLREALQRLQSQVTYWKDRNLLVAPASGLIVFTDALTMDSYIDAGVKLAEIRSITSSSLIGQCKVSLRQSGMVEEGHKVLLDFYDFPAAQYGFVEGIVADKSKVPEGETLKVYIRFPDGLVTHRGQELSIGENMLAKMEIVLSEKSLLEWLFRAY